MLKLSNVKKRMAIVKSVGIKNGEILISRSRGDGSTVGIRITNNFTTAKWATFSVEELRLALDYVTLPTDEFNAAFKPVATD